MTKNQQFFSVAAILTALVLIVVLVPRYVLVKNSKNIRCGDGVRELISLPDFTRQYFSSSVALAVIMELSPKVSTKFNPDERRRLSDSLESAALFRRSFVGNYNRCAVTRVQFERDFARLRTLDDLAQGIDHLVSRPALSQEENDKLGSLVGQFIARQGNLGADNSR